MFDQIYVWLFVIGLPFFLYAVYNIIISLAGFRKYEAYKQTKPKNRFAAVVAARNEEGVIGNLVDSLKHSNYPAELLDVWVIPNNCTDNTGKAAAKCGAYIYNPVGDIHSKGDALREFFDYTFSDNDTYDAFCVIDADNLVDPNFFARMNDALEAGESIAQGYRESKNPKDSWISGSQSMFYWMTNRFLNLAKRRLGMSAALNGTGFMVSREVLQDGGFDTFTLTEDIEFTTQNVLAGRRIAFISEAVTYDEHPVDFSTSWKQRKRWSTGIIQVLYAYGPKLWKQYRETKQWIYMDMILYLIAPFIQVISFVYFAFTLSIYTAIAVYSNYINASLLFALALFAFGLVFSVAYSAFVVKFENHRLSDCTKSTFFGFWVFLTSWTFINIVVFFKPLDTWEPIEHTHCITLSELQPEPAKN